MFQFFFIIISILFVLQKAFFRVYLFFTFINICV